VFWAKKKLGASKAAKRSVRIFFCIPMRWFRRLRGWRYFMRGCKPAVEIDF